MANLMRKFADKTGMRLGGSMEEAIARMEAGENLRRSNGKWAISMRRGTLQSGGDEEERPKPVPVEAASR